MPGLASDLRRTFLRPGAFQNLEDRLEVNPVLLHPANGPDVGEAFHEPAPGTVLRPTMHPRAMADRHLRHPATSHLEQGREKTMQALVKLQALQSLPAKRFKGATGIDDVVMRRPVPKAIGKPRGEPPPPVVFPPGAHPADHIPVFQQPYQARDLHGIILQITVERDHRPPSRQAKTGSHRRRLAQIPPEVSNANSIIGGLLLTKLIQRSVGAAVIHKEQLDRTLPAGQGPTQLLHQGADVLGLVVYRNDYAERDYFHRRMTAVARKSQSKCRPDSIGTPGGFRSELPGRSRTPILARPARPSANFTGAGGVVATNRPPRREFHKAETRHASVGSRFESNYEVVLSMKGVFMLPRKLKLEILVLLLTGLLGLGACNLQKSGSTPDDKTIATEIQAQLFQDSVLKTRDVRVVSQKGAVVMTGTVATELEKAAALRIAQKTPGVQQVIDQLRVGEASAAALNTPDVAPPASEAAPDAAPETQPSRPPRKARPPAHARASAPPAARHAVRQAAPAPNPAPPERVAAVSEPDAATMAQTAQPAPPPPPPPAPAAPPPPAPVVREPEPITLPAGTVVRVQTIDRIDSARNRPGDEFAATVESPLVEGDHVVIPRNADARLRLVDARTAGSLTGRSELQVELIGLTVGGVSYPVQSSVHEQQGASRSKRTAQTVGGGAVLGALIGAIAGGGKGAAIGTAVGAGSGTAVQVITHGDQVKIPPETKLEFTLRAPLTVKRERRG